MEGSCVSLEVRSGTIRHRGGVVVLPRTGLHHRPRQCQVGITPIGYPMEQPRAVSQQAHYVQLTAQRNQNNFSRSILFAKLKALRAPRARLAIVAACLTASL